MFFMGIFKICGRGRFEAKKEAMNDEGKPELRRTC
jgi:hypothetical protein